MNIEIALREGIRTTAASDMVASSSCMLSHYFLGFLGRFWFAPLLQKKRYENNPPSRFPPIDKHSHPKNNHKIIRQQKYQGEEGGKMGQEEDPGGIDGDDQGRGDGGKGKDGRIRRISKGVLG